MKYGAIAVLDALGFKGIWSRYDSRLVFKKLRNAKEVASNKFGEGDNAARLLHLFQGNPHVKFNSWEIRFLSDTALLAVMPPPGFEAPPIEGPIERWRLMQSYFVIGDLMYVIANFLSYVGCTCEKPSLSYRGCLTIGEFQIEDEFVIGPAIDEAAELANAAEGAFCWMTPHTCEQFEIIHNEWQEFARQTPGCPTQAHLEGLVPRYKVPLKNGEFCASRVVNPLAACRPGHREEFVEELLSTFMPLDNRAVARKRENTERFLRFAATLPPDAAMFQSTVIPNLRF